MYDYLEGRVCEKTIAHLVLDVGGVGYKIFVSSNTYGSLDKVFAKAKIYVHFQQTEETVNLYGFLEKEERDFFELVISVSGVGPKLAMKMLSSMSYLRIIEMIFLEDKEGLSGIQGLGPKTSARMLLDLRDKVKKLSTSFSGSQVAESIGVSNIALQTKEALSSLGYKDFEIAKVLDLLSKDKDNIDLEASIKKALSLLTPSKR